MSRDTSPLPLWGSRWPNDREMVAQAGPVGRCCEPQAVKSRQGEALGHQPEALMAESNIKRVEEQGSGPD